MIFFKYKTVLAVAAFSLFIYKDSLYAADIIFDAPRDVKTRIRQLIIEAEKTKVGKDLLLDIASSPHTLTLQHAAWAVDYAGRTDFKLSRNISNGVGVDVTVIMNFEIPLDGSHIVQACSGGRISFTALMNFIHELKHARDGMMGQISNYQHEQDAVNAENLLREELGIKKMRCLRSDEDDIWKINF